MQSFLISQEKGKNILFPSLLKIDVPNVNNDKTTLLLFCVTMIKIMARKPASYRRKIQQDAPGKVNTVMENRRIREKDGLKMTDNVLG